eukprot:gene39010-51306_t
MANYASKYPADFLIALGDNFYNSGVTSISDSLWTLFYNNVYNYDSLQIPWYAIFGNHDYGSNKGTGSTQAQIDYGTYKLDNRWNAGHCYMQSYTVPNSDATMDMVYIDSTLIAPEETYMTSTASGISSSTQSYRKNAQLQCLEHYLSNSTAQYLIVAGHYPIFSTGKNSPGDMTSMVEAVYPLLEKYNVDMYLCGHDHRLEHLSYKTASGGTMDFIVSGAAGKPDNQLSNGITSDATSMFAAATGGFAFAEVSDTGISVNMVNSAGAVLYNMYRARQRVVFSSATELGSAEKSSSSNNNNNVKNEADQSSGNNKNQNANNNNNGQEQEQENSARTQYMNSYLTNAVMKELVEVGVLVSCIAAFIVIVGVLAAPRFNRTTAITKSVRKLTTPMDVDPATVDVESGWNKPRGG